MEGEEGFGDYQSVLLHKDGFVYIVEWARGLGLLLCDDWGTWIATWFGQEMGGESLGKGELWSAPKQAGTWTLGGELKLHERT